MRVASNVDWLPVEVVVGGRRGRGAGLEKAGTSDVLAFKIGQVTLRLPAAGVLALSRGAYFL